MKPGAQGVDHRHEAALHDLPAPLHGPRLDHVRLEPAHDLDRQGRLPGPEATRGRPRGTAPGERQRPDRPDETPRRADLEVPVLRGLPAGAPAAGPEAWRRGPGRPGPSGRRALAPAAAGARGGAWPAPGPALRADWAVRRAPAGSGGQRDPVPGPRLPARRRPPTPRSWPGSTSRGSSPSAPRWSEAGGRSSWAATWGAHRGAALALPPGGPAPAAGPAAQARLARAEPPVRPVEPAPAVGLLPPPRPARRVRRPSACSAPGRRCATAWRSTSRRHPLGRPERPPRPPAGPAADVPVGLGRPGRPDPRPGLPPVLHPPPRRPVRPDDRPALHPRPRRRARRPSPATSPASKPRSPPIPPTPSPTCSGPATAPPPPPTRTASPPAPAAASPPSPSPDPRARCGCPAWTSSVGWAPSISY